MNYIYISDGIDNGKPFNSLKEAIGYLHQQALHSKIHLDGILKNMEITENSFFLYIEKYHFLMGRSVEKIGIRVALENDAQIIKSYFEINKI